MNQLLTPMQKEYLIEIAPGKFAEDIALLMNEKFGLQLTAAQIKQYKSRNKIKSGIKGVRNPAKLFTPEQDQFIRDNNFGHTSIEIANMINDAFGLSIIPEQIKAFRARYKLPSCGLTGRFEKGIIPFNKGMKMPGHGAKQTFFKIGHRPKNALPVGTVMMKADGYIYEKIAEPNKWMPKHVLVWEAANGARPKDTAIIFLDRNRTNFAIENLACVSRAELARLNQNNLIHENAEISKAGVLIAKIMTKVGERRKRGKPHERQKA